MNTTSPKMATVGIVEWSTTLANVNSAQIVYALDNADTATLNRGGTAPVDMTQPNHHTLLLGLKQSSTYTFHVEATSTDGTSCRSADSSLSTGTLPGTPSITRTATNPSAQAVGFIITSAGASGSLPAIIIDADGSVVWSAPAPTSCTRARMDYEGANLWMMAMNVTNSGGEMRYLSMDGQSGQNNVSGLSSAHHDFTVRKGGIVAALVWASSGTDVPSDLVEHSPDGTNKTIFHIGSNLYVGAQSTFGAGSDTYHCNSVHYHPTDDTFTISDRNASMYVKVTRAGSLLWQFGGACDGAPAPACVAGTWQVNHGHHLFDNGDFVFFNNGSPNTPSMVREFTLAAAGGLSAAPGATYKSSGNQHNESLGDVQRLPNGNTLVTFSNSGLIQELDPSWNIVQTLEAPQTSRSFGYSDWRATLYGAPERP